MNFAKEYVIRTNLQASRISRANQCYNYFDNNGVVQSVTVPAPLTPDTLAFTTRISEIDSIAGTLDSGFPLVWNSSLSVPSGSDAFATYVLVASQNLNLTVTDVTINTPFQCTLEASPATDTPEASATVTLTGTVSTTTVNPTGTVTFFYEGVEIGTSAVLNNTGTLVVPAASVPIPTGVTGTFSPSGSTAAGTVTVVSSPATQYTFSVNYNSYAQELIGPNTVDALDVLIPSATVTQSGGIVERDDHPRNSSVSGVEPDSGLLQEHQQPDLYDSSDRRPSPLEVPRGRSCRR